MNATPIGPPVPRPGRLVFGRLVGDGEAGAVVGGAVDLVDEGQGEVGAGDLRLARGIGQQDVAAGAVLAGRLARVVGAERGGGGDEEPVRPVLSARSVSRASAALPASPLNCAGNSGVSSSRGPPSATSSDAAPPTTPSLVPCFAAAAVSAGSASASRTSPSPLPPGPKRIATTITSTSAAADSTSAGSCTSPWRNSSP